uniref:FBA domain-containing protein n=1 Tax=Parascaris univalens TaxID=6257 RepID=A0A915BM55_PARUN
SSMASRGGLRKPRLHRFSVAIPHQPEPAAAAAAGAQFAVSQAFRLLQKAALTKDEREYVEPVERRN